MPVYKDEARKTWYTSFYYTDWQGKKKRKKKEGFKTQKEAKAFEVNFLNKQQADCDMLFSNLVELYFEDCKTRLKPTTFNNKEYTINLKLLPYFGDTPLNKITSASVRQWQNEMIKLGYSQTYLKTLHNQASAIFNFAVKYYGLQSNPARQCGSMGKKNADSMQFWTVEEFKKFMEVVSDKPASKLAFNLLFWSGIRLGELLALTLNDFDCEAKTMSINKNFARLEGKDLILEPKTPKSKRTITLPENVFLMLDEYLKQLYDYKSSNRLFSITKSYLHHEMERGCKHSEAKKIRIHDLRHSHASLLIELGFSPILISERLGHENIETTLQTYSHLYPNKHAEVADKLATLID